jgi:UDP-GlcNAc:undecaprenyl-phosphate GlcNAc-1-phosphate transferase
MWYLIYIYVLLVSTLSSLLLTRLMIGVSHRLGIYDMPYDRKNHPEPIPYLGGAAIYLSLMGVVAIHILLLKILGDKIGFISAISEHLYFSASLGEKPAVWRALGIVLGGTLIFTVGMIDDMRPLRARWKLAAQVAAGLIVVSFGVRLELFIESPILASAVTIAWIVFVINSFNFMDNMDGLCAGISAIAALIFFFVVFPLNQTLTAVILLVTAGSALGFLFYNFNPARIFMGDAGAMFLGFMLASLTVSGTFYMQDGMSRWGLLTPIFVLGVPIFDTVGVIYLRLRARLPIHIGDNRHFSHRLVNLGMSKRDSVIFIYLVAVSVGLGATLLRYVTLLGAVTLFIQTLGIFAIIILLMIADREKRIREQSDEPE